MGKLEYNKPKSKKKIEYVIQYTMTSWIFLNRFFLDFPNLIRSYLLSLYVF
jgi:hypothetical protein